MLHDADSCMRGGSDIATPPRIPSPHVPRAYTQPPDRGYAHNRDTTEPHKTHRCGRAGQADCAGAASSALLARIVSVRLGDT